MDSTIYGIEYQTRTLCPQYTDDESTGFFVGTQTPRAENQVHLVKYDDEEDAVSATVYSHPAGEVWALSNPASQPDVIATCHRVSLPGRRCEASVWRLGVSETAKQMDQPEPLELLFDLGAGQPVSSVVWHPENASSIVAVGDGKVRVWDVAIGKESSSSPRAETGDTTVTTPVVHNCRWSPHHGAAHIATAGSASVDGWDLRAMTRTFRIPEAHLHGTRDLDFNPNKQYHIVTCGEDGLVKFWDTRNYDRPLLAFANHSHWSHSVRFNSFHDQLVLSGSSVAETKLINAGSISSDLFSAPDSNGGDNGIVDGSNSGGDDDDDTDTTGPIPDGLVATYDEHEDSVYACEWSSADPWVFATLSFDGRLVINHVPKSTKYQILL